MKNITTRKKIIIILVGIIILCGLIIGGIFVFPFIHPLTMKTSDGVIYTVYENHAEVTGCKKDCDKVIHVKEAVLGREVTAIGQEAFKSTDIEEIYLPDTVVEIKKYAFLLCSKLSYVDLGNSLKRIELQGFHICPKLTQIELPDSLEYIGNHAFYEMDTITIPENVKEIGSGAFCFIPEVIYLTDDVNIQDCNMNYDKLKSADEKFVTYYHSLLYCHGNPGEVIVIPNDVYYLNCIFPEGSTIYIPDSVKALDFCLTLVGNTTVYIPSSVENIYNLPLRNDKVGKIYVCNNPYVEEILNSQYEPIPYEVVDEIVYPQ